MIWELYANIYSLVEKFEPYKEHFNDIVNNILKIAGTRNIKILNIGIGSGHLEKKLLEQKNIEIFSIDVSKRMLEKARRRLQTHDAGRLHLLLHDVNNPMPFEENMFDLVVMNNVFYALKQKKKLLLEIRPILRDNGQIIISDPKKDFNYLRFIRADFINLVGKKIFAKIIHYIIYFPLLVLMMIINLTIDIKWGFSRNGYLTYEQVKKYLLDCGYVIRSGGYSYGGQSYLFYAEKK